MTSPIVIKLAMRNFAKSRKRSMQSYAYNLILKKPETGVHIVSISSIIFGLQYLYDSTMEYLKKTYHSYGTNLKSIELSDAHLADIQMGEAAANFYADNILSSGDYAITYDGNGLATHCDGEPIGNCVF